MTNFNQNPTGTFPQWQPGYGQQHEPRQKRRNAIGVIALVVAVLGAILACVPGIVIVGWILLPVGFVLGLVGLFASGKRKGSAVAAVIVSIVGTVIGVLFFIAFIGNSLDDAFGDGDVTVSEARTESSGSESGTDDTATRGVGGSVALGSHGNPASIGSVITSGDWEVVVNSFDANSTDDVLAANPFNQAPSEGNQYAVVNVTATYRGEESGDASYISVAYVTEAGNVIESYETNAVSPDPSLDGEMYAGASITGNEVLEVPENDEGLLRMELGLFGDEVFVEL